jgi:hypothetical protein
MTRRTKKLVLGGVGVLLAGMLFIPLPLRIKPEDKQAAVSHAITALLRNRRVLTERGFNSGRGYRQLEETSFVKDGQFYFLNDLGIPDTVFLKHGLKPVPNDRKFITGAGVVLVWFSNRDIQGKSVEHLQFAYHFGPMGAHGYVIRIYKSLATRYFVYAHQWIS